MGLRAHGLYQELEKLVRFSTVGDRPADEEELKKAVMACVNVPYLTTRPFISKASDIQQVVDRVLAAGDTFDDNAWAVCRETAFLQRMCYNGFFTMALMLGDEPRDSVVLGKLDLARCLFGDLDAIKATRSTRKTARRFRMSVDGAFDEVAEACLRQHGSNWLGCLVNEYRAMHANPGNGTRMHSVEVWDEEGQLVAGELGWACGAIYTSATGFTGRSGAGTVQLVALGRLLKEKGFRLWDLGMGMPYKFRLGASTLPQRAFVARVRELRDVPCVLECGERRNCRAVIDSNSPDRLTETGAQSSTKAAARDGAEQSKTQRKKHAKRERRKERRRHAAQRKTELSQQQQQQPSQTKSRHCRVNDADRGEDMEDGGEQR